MMPEEDSEDLTEAEMALAVETSGPDDFGKHLTDLSKDLGQPTKHELRRKRPHLYCRTTFPNMILLFRVDWLQ